MFVLKLFNLILWDNLFCRYKLSWFICYPYCLRVFFPPTRFEMPLFLYKQTNNIQRHWGCNNYLGRKSKENKEMCSPSSGQRTSCVHIFLSILSTYLCLHLKEESIVTVQVFLELFSEYGKRETVFWNFVEAEPCNRLVKEQWIVKETKAKCQGWVTL